MTALVLVAALSFLLMGGVALASPDRVVGLFEASPLTTAGRNEVRAVYGGFGVASAGIVAWALYHPDAAAALAALGIALWGMAGGRVLSALVDRSMGAVPALLLAVELVLGLVLVSAGLHAT